MDQLPRLGKRGLICLLLFTCNYVVFVGRGFFLWVLGMGYVILLWHSLSLPYNYFLEKSRDSDLVDFKVQATYSPTGGSFPCPRDTPTIGDTGLSIAVPNFCLYMVPLNCFRHPDGKWRKVAVIYEVIQR